MGKEPASLKKLGALPLVSATVKIEYATQLWCERQYNNNDNDKSHDDWQSLEWLIMIDYDDDRWWSDDEENGDLWSWWGLFMIIMIGADDWEGCVMKMLTIDGDED